MLVIIDEIVSTLRAISGEAVLAPETMRQIVTAVLEAVHQDMDHGRRTRAEIDLRGVAESHRRGQP